jgi:hypothetical protein
MALTMIRLNQSARAILLLVILLLAALPAMPTLAQSQETALIIAPSTGQTLIGMVTITGTATSANFSRFKLEFSLENSIDGDLWFPIAEVAQQVSNAPLAQWNTSSYPDGLYKIRLRVFLRDDNYLETIMPGLIVANQAQTALPTPLLAATNAPATTQPTAGPTPTSIIQQPPTLTPRPTFAGGAATLPANTDGGGGELSTSAQIVVAVGAVQSAFCNGVAIAVVLFGLLFVYRVFAVRVRPRITRLLAESQRDDD